MEKKDAFEKVARTARSELETFEASKTKEIKVRLRLGPEINTSLGGHYEACAIEHELGAPDRRHVEGMTACACVVSCLCHVVCSVRLRLFSQIFLAQLQKDAES